MFLRFFCSPSFVTYVCVVDGSMFHKPNKTLFQESAGSVIKMVNINGGTLRGLLLSDLSVGLEAILHLT